MGSFLQVELHAWERRVQDILRGWIRILALRDGAGQNVHRSKFWPGHGGPNVDR